MSTCMMADCENTPDGGNGLCQRHYDRAYPTDEFGMDFLRHRQRHMRAEHDRCVEDGTYQRIYEQRHLNQPLVLSELLGEKLVVFGKSMMGAMYEDMVDLGMVYPKRPKEDE